MYIEILRTVDNIVWGPWLLFLLLGTGIYLMIGLKWLPLRQLKYALLCSVGMGDRNNRKNELCKPKGVSSFSSLTTELAATIGTGNIVGVATAMVLGGPGALLWMVISALIGMATKLVESMLAVKYHKLNSKGEYKGGPMYTMIGGIKFKQLGRILAYAFAAFAVMASLGMGNMTQANSIAEAFDTSYGIPMAKTGLVVTILTIFVILGGLKSISKVTTVLVPFMGIFYILACLAVIATHIYNIPQGLACMVSMAFAPKAIGGGMCGGIVAGFSESIRWGVARGVFSNEAGLGAAGISAAATDTEDYIKQGYISMTGVFLDTVVICTVTGLAIISSGKLGTMDAGGELITGIELITAVFGTTFGKSGVNFTAVSIALFAFATIVGWEYQGERAFEFIMGEKNIMYYRFVYALSTFCGAILGLEAVWTFSDICNALMAVPNLICVLVLSGKAIGEIKSDAQRRGI